VIDATVEERKPDVNEATRRFTQAMKHAQSADRCVDNESGYILLYAAVHKAFGAVLVSIGLRVTAGDRGHAVLIQEAKKHLGKEHVQLLSRLDRARRKRNEVAYETAQIANDELATMKKDTLTALGAAGRFIQEQKPSPASD